MDARRHWLCAGLLVAFATAVQGWCVSRAAVPALDAVRYIGIAKDLAAHGWQSTLADEAEHPLFPALIVACRTVLRTLRGDSPSLWIESAQLVAATMLVLAVVPLYFFALRGAGEWPALAAGAFYCLMIEIASLGADALSDSTQLFFVACALWSLARYWNTEFDSSGKKRLPTPFWLAPFGVCTALAMMARAESCLLLAAGPLAILASQSRSTWRQPWLQCAAGLACLVLGWLAVTGPYLWSADSLAPRAALCRVLGREQPERTIAAAIGADPMAQSKPTASKELRLPSGEPATFGVKDRGRSTRFHGYGAALQALAEQLSAASNYWIGALALCGMFLASRLPMRPLDLFVAVFAILYLAGLTHMAAGLGYLMPRHLLPLVIAILAPAGYAACQLPNLFPSPRATMQGAVTILASLACLPCLLLPPHGTHAGHRAAGEWLASQDEGFVLDSRGWTTLYSGRRTERFDAAEAALRDPALAYVVVEQREVDADSARSRTLRHVLSQAAEPAMRFQANRGIPADAVLVYRWRPQRLAKLANPTNAPQ